MTTEMADSESESRNWDGERIARSSIIEVIAMDTEIRDAVERELSCCDRLTSAEIRVTVQDGVVTLSGIVNECEDELAALRAAERVAGVDAVASELAVRSRDPLERCDTELARDAAHALALNTSVPRHRVQIEVSRGWIRLKGTVDTESQKNAAADAVSSTLAGARGLVTLIDVKPLVPPLNSQ